MTKAYSTALLLLLLCFGTLRGQTITSCNPGFTTAGASVTLIVTGTGTNFSSATGAYVYRPGWGGALYQATNFTPSNNTTMSMDINLPPNAPIGGYTVGVYGPTDLGNGLTVGIGGGSAYGYVSGYVNYDYNANCTKDPGEPGIPNRIVTIGTHNVSTDVNGFYSAWLPLGNYTITTSYPAPYHVYTCGGFASANLNIALDSVNNANIYMDTIQVSDLAVYMNASFMRPGFSAYGEARVKNLGNAASQPTTGYFIASTTSFSTSSPYGGSSSNGDTVFYNIPSIPGGDSYYMGISGTLSPTATLGTTLGFRAHVDDVGSNNDGVISRTVTGAYDPNDKQVWDEDGNNADGFVEPSDSVLRYLIRFQNTGTDTAFNIYVRDTFSQNVDIASLNVENVSHGWTMNVNGDAVQWTFPNILLVDSFANEPLSHGYIGYTVKLKPGLPIGTQIDNTAHIYFDFNAPVVTNTVSTVICPEILPSYTFFGAGNTLNFTGAATGSVTTWQWNFGDGNTSNVQNPSHTYAASGSYNVCLYTTNSCGRIDSTCQTVQSNCAGPTSVFNTNVSNTLVAFTDMTTGSPSSWFWDFGDGNNSALANPSHNYTTPGTYTACLVTGNGCGFDTTCQSVTVSCPTHTAGFSSTANQLSASFTNSGSGGTTYFWTFGDGNSSTANNPSHTYTQAGTYNVCLVSTNSCDVDSICQTVTVTCPTHTAGFSSTATQLSASFTNSSNGGTTYFWTFGDGNSSTANNPSHTYTQAGTYNVCLVSTNTCDVDSTCQTVTVTCPTHTAGFSSATTQLSASFTNSSNGGTTYFWTFGDGNSSTASNPSHTYTQAGTYNVCLVSNNSCDTDSICQTVTVVCPAPGSAFSSSVNSATASFSDQSAGSPTSWFWTFGDGSSSTLQNPSHTYAISGTFTVCLVATNNCDADTTCQSVTVTCVAPTSSYGNTVAGPLASFTDLSTGSPTAWFWTFGDGSSSTAQNPTHTYLTSGTFNVCLVATSICGSDTMCNTVVVTCAAPFASFNAQQIAATVSFIDQSNNAPTQWAWDFGDGFTSNLQNPVHTYQSSGAYTACLIASNNCGSDTNCLTLNAVVGLENELVNQFDLYPNPAQDRFVVHLELNEQALVGFSLYNSVGSLVQTVSQSELSGDVRKEFDVSALSSGIYLLEMRINGQSRTWKVMVQ